MLSCNRLFFAHQFWHNLTWLPRPFFRIRATNWKVLWSTNDDVVEMGICLCPLSLYTRGRDSHMHAKQRGRKCSSPAILRQNFTTKVLESSKIKVKNNCKRASFFKEFVLGMFDWLMSDDSFVRPSKLNLVDIYDLLFLKITTNRPLKKLETLLLYYRTANKRREWLLKLKSVF